MATLASELEQVLNSGVARGPGETITVYFVPSGQSWTEPDGTTHTSLGWSAYERGQAEAALAQISNVANINFVTVNTPAGADFVLGTQSMSGGTVGYFYLPVGSGTQYGAFNSAATWFWDASPGGSLAQGGAVFETFLHEFGHGLGMVHPHDGGLYWQAPLAFPGVNSASDVGTGQLNQAVFTVMSYNFGWETAPHGGTPAMNYGYMGTMGALDIAWLQSIYGANTSFAAGSDTYYLPGVNGAGTFYASIWDTGGIDTIAHTGALGATINLNPATLQVETGGGGFVSYAQGIHGGYTIAAGVVIENAIGGSGNDTLIGNGVDNVLTGNAGADVILDALGDDDLRGGLGGDALIEAFGHNTLTGGAGFDFLVGGLQSDTLDGGTGNDMLAGDPAGALTGGGDTLTGGAGDDILMGGAGADVFIFHPNHGADRIAHINTGGYGGDPVTGVASMTTLAGGADFQLGLDEVHLTGFATVHAGNVMGFVTIVGGDTQFSAEGTTITFEDVTGITADDFVFV